MKQHLNDLLLRRGRLLERIAHQRSALSDHVEPVHAALDRTDRFFGQIFAAVHYLRTHPLGVAAAALAAVYVVKPRRAWRWAARAFSAWQTLRMMRGRFGAS